MTSLTTPCTRRAQTFWASDTHTHGPGSSAARYARPAMVPGAIAGASLHAAARAYARSLHAKWNEQRVNVEDTDV
jgi:hypothetical protein